MCPLREMTGDAGARCAGSCVAPTILMRVYVLLG